MSRRHPHGRHFPRVAVLGDAPGGNYTAKLLRLADMAKRGTVGVVEIRHDAGCPLLTRGGICTCEPEVELQPLPDPRGPKS